VQTVGQLDHEDADILGHRQQQLAEVLRLLVVGLEFETGQLGDAVDQTGNVAAELLFQFGEAGRGVLDGVVEQRGGQRVHVHPKIRQDRRHGQRVDKVGLTRLSGLLVVSLSREEVGPCHQGSVGVW